MNRKSPRPREPSFLTSFIGTLYFIHFLRVAKQRGISQYSFVVLMCLISDKDKQFFIHLRAIHIFPSMNCQFVCVAYFLLDFLCFSY